MNRRLVFLTIALPAAVIGWFPPARAQTANDNWDGRFGPPGVGGTVVTIAINADDVYVGGTFTTSGGINATNIARWNPRGG